jgi:hypothetical protein
MPFTKKNVQFASDAGRRGAIRRWQGHPRRVVKLAELTSDQRRLVLALLDANRADSR